MAYNFFSDIKKGYFPKINFNENQANRKLYDKIGITYTCLNSMCMEIGPGW